FAPARFQLRVAEGAEISETDDRAATQGLLTDEAAKCLRQERRPGPRRLACEEATRARIALRHEREWARELQARQRRRGPLPAPGERRGDAQVPALDGAVRRKCPTVNRRVPAADEEANRGDRGDSGP